jgi:hypothetical protein
MNTLVGQKLPFAEGRTAEIFEWDTGTILKLFREWCPADWIDCEAGVARLICDAGINTPAVKDVVEINGRHGIVYERVEGISMLSDMNSRPWLIFKRARQLAELQAQCLRLNIPGLRRYRDSLESAIRSAVLLPEELRGPVLNLLQALPEGNALCHADFHPGNILITRRGPVVIDWMTASCGSPWADIARTSLLLTIGPIGEGKRLSPIIRLIIQIYYQTYLGRIKALIPDEQHEQKRWLPVVAAARLEERILPEKDALIETIRAGLR